MKYLFAIGCLGMLTSFLIFTPFTQETPYLYKSEIYETYEGCFDGSQTYNCDWISWHHSFIGNYQTAIEVDNQSVHKSKRDSILDLSQFRLVTAKDYVLQQAKENQIVIFNEAHHRPEHRIYTADYLAELYEMGYRHLGLEGLEEEQDSLMNRGRPVYSSGFYPREPQFANLMREALKLGYTIFPYDFTGSTKKGIEKIKERERKQATNIANVLDENPTTKIVLHVGYGHIREDTAVLGGLMAYQLKKITGINPLTVGQARYNGESKQEFEHEYYHEFPQFISSSTLIFKELNIPYNDSIVDIDIFHPRIKDTLGRASYLINNERYKTKRFAIPEKIEWPILACLYQSIENTNYSNEVPIDMIYLDSPSDSVHLSSPFLGKTELVFFDKNKKIFEKQLVWY